MRAFIAPIAAAALALLPAGAWAAGATEIAVTGTGSVTLAPDLATVDAAVETTAPDAAGAVAQNNAVYDRIVGSLEKLGIARGDVTLSYYNVGYTPKPAPGDTSAPQRWGYTVSRGFTVRVRELGKAGAVADACTRAGATSINGVSFAVADDRAARRQAVAKAVDDARENANALASAAGLRVTGIERIDLGTDGGGPMRPMLKMNAAAAPTQFDQSNVNVSVTVTVTFLAAP